MKNQVLKDPTGKDTEKEALRVTKESISHEQKHKRAVKNGGSLSGNNINIQSSGRMTARLSWVKPEANYFEKSVRQRFH